MWISGAIFYDLWNLWISGQLNLGHNGVNYDDDVDDDDFADDDDGEHMGGIPFLAIIESPGADPLHYIEHRPLC